MLVFAYYILYLGDWEMIEAVEERWEAVGETGGRDEVGSARLRRTAVAALAGLDGDDFSGTKCY